MSSAFPLPVVRPLAEDFSLVDAFDKLHSLPGCLWLDSAAPGPSDVASIDTDSDTPLGRYSFLTADPIETWQVDVDQPNPWPQLSHWCRRLPNEHVPDLPPFQGGIAGVIAYEAGAWLEPVGYAALNDLPTPALSLGLYDWTIAVDHQRGRGWIISQGLGHDEPSERHATAVRRADQVESWLAESAQRKHANLDAKSIARAESRRETKGSRAGARPQINSNFTSQAFRDSVSEIVRRIHDGDSFQVNLAQRLQCDAQLPAAELYRRLRVANPAPFGAYYAGRDFTVLSSSPERFLKVDDGLVETRPIKGTTPRTGHAEEDRRLAEALAHSEKDRAENIMIVDLMRNDLSRVCLDDSITARQLCQVERYQYVQHLVSVVEGQLRPEATIADLLQACFPGGSVTGAPKIEAMRTIAALEPHHRGPYCGSIGYISGGGKADFNILIRTITAAHGQWQIPVGGGITAQSDPAAEEAETWAKAEGMLRALD